MFNYDNLGMKSINGIRFLSINIDYNRDFCPGKVAIEMTFDDYNLMIKVLSRLEDEGKVRYKFPLVQKAYDKYINLLSLVKES